MPPPTGAALCGEKPNLRTPSDTPAPGCRSALEPGCVGLKRGYDGYSCSSILPGVATPTTWALTFSPEWPTKRPVARFSVALPPGTPKGCFTGVLSAESRTGPGGRESSALRPPPPRRFAPGRRGRRLCESRLALPQAWPSSPHSGRADASGTLQRKAQPSCAERHLTPQGDDGGSHTP